MAWPGIGRAARFGAGLPKSLQLVTNFRVMNGESMRFLLLNILSCALCCVSGVLAPVHADNGIYKQVAPSTVWFFERGSATGVLVDVDSRLILTAEHVV